MTFGAAARQVFGDAIVNKFASAAAADANRHLVSMDFLAAAFSAAHFVRLMGQTAWSSEDQERMLSGLVTEVRLALGAGHDEVAASRAASHQMLTTENPWTWEETEGARKALSSIPDENDPYVSVVVAAQIADYLLLGGPIFWSETEFHDMRSALIADFEDTSGRGDDVLAANRLAIFDVLEASLETFTMT